jgi:hypothetical protein
MSTDQTAVASETWSAGPNIVLGLIFLAVGLYFLFNPGVPVDDALGATLGHTVVNLQRLAFGQSFTVSGAIFLAIALRPRR